MQSLVTSPPSLPHELPAPPPFLPHSLPAPPPRLPAPCQLPSPGGEALWISLYKVYIEVGASTLKFSSTYLKLFFLQKYLGLEKM